MYRLKTILGATLLGIGGTAMAQRDTLDIYWIDVEGGAATLIVTPSGQSALMDAGWRRDDNRDGKRVRAAMADAGVESLDYLIASHFHGDHAGGIPQLLEQVQVGEIIDHGDSVEQDSPRHGPIWDAYVSAAGGQRRRVVPGDTLPLAGVDDFRFVAADHEIIEARSGAVAANPRCEGASAFEEDLGENGRSLAYVLSLGRFEFADVGDLTPDVQHELVCPHDRIGEIDLLQAPHHGNDIAPHFVATLNPIVAVSNTGASKGGGPEGYEAMHAAPDLAAYWQLHRASASDGAHNTAERMTANPTEDDDQGYWIKAEVAGDGSSFTLVNGRNGHRETYLSR
jgi:beta-lactamase superfamily II metal-dependent hydrolase